MIKAWKENTEIPYRLRRLGPIPVFDNCRIHSKTESMIFSSCRLPKYSPFINLAEPINLIHKSIIKKLYFTHMTSFLQELEHSEFGQTTKIRNQFLLRLAYLAWDEISDDNTVKCWKSIVLKYFPDCLSMKPILN
jgi:hypothetical protein